MDLTFPPEIGPIQNRYKIFTAVLSSKSRVMDVIFTFYYDISIAPHGEFVVIRCNFNSGHLWQVRMVRSGH